MRPQMAHQKWQGPWPRRRRSSGAAAAVTWVSNAAYGPGERRASVPGDLRGFRGAFPVSSCIIRRRRRFRFLVAAAAGGPTGLFAFAPALLLLLLLFGLGGFCGFCGSFGCCRYLVVCFAAAVLIELRILLCSVIGIVCVAVARNIVTCMPSVPSKANCCSKITCSSLFARSGGPRRGYTSGNRQKCARQALARIALLLLLRAGKLRKRQHSVTYKTKAVRAPASFGFCFLGFCQSFFGISLAGILRAFHDLFFLRRFGAHGLLNFRSHSKLEQRSGTSVTACNLQAVEAGESRKHLNRRDVPKLPLHFQGPQTCGTSAAAAAARSDTSTSAHTTHALCGGRPERCGSRAGFRF
jgi:hypothetical protein